MVEYQRKQFFFPKNINWDEILPPEGQPHTSFSITLLDDKGNKREFKNLKTGMNQRINGALFLSGSIVDDPSGVFYRLEIVTYDDNPEANTAYLYPTGWPTSMKTRKKK